MEIYSSIPNLEDYLPELPLHAGGSGPTAIGTRLTKLFIHANSVPHFGDFANKVGSEKALRMGEGLCEIYAEGNRVGVNFFQPNKKVMRRILVACFANPLSLLGHLVLHGAAFELPDREADLILGASRTGKSTMCRLWEENGGRVLCENYCLLDPQSLWMPFLDIRPWLPLEPGHGLRIRKIFVLVPVENGKAGSLPESPRIEDYSVSNYFLDVFGVMPPEDRETFSHALAASLRRLSGLPLTPLPYSKGVDPPETVFSWIAEGHRATRQAGGRLLQLTPLSVPGPLPDHRNS
jgi:hypothetical protein